MEVEVLQREAVQIRHVSHRIAVMYLRRVVETGSVAEICDAPTHPYTQALISAVPAAGKPGPSAPWKSQNCEPADVPAPSACLFERAHELDAAT